MKKAKYGIFLLEFLLIIFLFFALFTSKILMRYVLAFGLAGLTIFLKFNFRIKSNDYIYSKQVNVLMILFGLIYIVVFYALGLYFGFTKAKFMFSLWTIWRFIIPFTLIIISSEYLRKILLSQEAKIEFRGKKVNLSLGLIFIIMVLIDLVVYTGNYDFNSFDDTLTALGFVLFSSVSCNLLYQYITTRFGPKGIVYYRLITTLFIYIIPITPDVYIFFRTFLRMIYPFIIYLVLENTYAKSNLALSYRSRRQNMVATAFTLLILSLLVMLISCRFKYGIIVVGSGSMTGTINKGDAIVYKRYDGGNIPNGQIVMFNKDGYKVIHRVIKISNVNGEMRYITKGDANREQDEDYRLEKDITGLVKLRVKYLGVPTLWLRSLFEK